MNKSRQCNPSSAELFFRAQSAGRAVELCLNCPLMIDCREAAREGGYHYGVWGGETPEERNAWMAEHHPDPEVREEAAREVERVVRTRERSRVADRNRNARLKQNLLKNPRPASTGQRSGPVVQRDRADQRASQARELLAAGRTPNEVAEELRISRRSLQRYLSRATAA
ncbi:WhiB family transcriptional regulator [Micromonospora sp. NBC_01813]|uniref:WhiB family transcriptional regulator n=1 Tax=Micromonospora sp. NBC_01813 TaxID=2975988 RepID=UPI002DDA20C7|nr:WhiB family transcriptional regulator [Micromonospora sp. NBC_01813]WSA11507.1 WhiB family transcriptional regulator [Micromonospora sp. NBC_01813]